MSSFSTRPGGLIRLAALAAFAALVVVGVFRPHLPEILRQHWAGAVVTLGLLATLLLLGRLRLAPPPDPYPAALGALFSLVLVALYLQPQRVASDGIFYFAPLRSLVVDGDLDFENEYRTLGAPEGYFQKTATGRLPNNFSLGPAIAWSPLYLAVHAVASLGFFRPSGFGYPYFTAVATTTAIFGFLGVLSVYRLARVYFDGPVAFGATALIWLGSFHFWYMTFEPSMSHALSMGAVGMFLVASQRGLRDSPHAVLTGAAAGLALLMRWQNAVFLPLPLAVTWSSGQRPLLSRVGLFAGTAALVFLPQALYWKILYGHFLLIPQGTSYLDWGSPHLVQVLFSSRHGLFSWTPVLWVAAAGLPAFVRRAPALGWSLLAALAALLYVNASVYDWWAGASFGARRFDGALPAFGLGLAAALDWMASWVRRHLVIAAGLALLPLVAWNLILVGAYSLGAVPLDGAVSFRQAASDGLELVYRLTGYPFSWPGAIGLRLRERAPLAVYDLAGALHFSNNVDIRMGDTDALYLGRGWSLARRARDRTFREGSPGGASLYAALREPAPYRLSVEGRAEGEVLVSVNDRVVGSLGLASDWVRAELAIPREAILAGLNQIAILPQGGGRFFVSRVILTRPGQP